MTQIHANVILLIYKILLHFLICENLRFLCYLRSFETFIFFPVKQKHPIVQTKQSHCTDRTTRLFYHYNRVAQTKQSEIPHFTALRSE